MPYKNHEKQKEFQRKWIKKRRKKTMDGRKCAMCGKPVSADTADLDHKKPHYNTEKKIDHRIWSLKKSKRDKKLKKMQVLCRACHKKKTKRDINNQHEGTSSLQQEIRESLDKIMTRFISARAGIPKG